MTVIEGVTFTYYFSFAQVDHKCVEIINFILCYLKLRDKHTS